MKTALFIFGLTFASIAIIIDTKDDWGSAGIGYFLLSSASFIGAAIWKSDRSNPRYYRTIQKVYSVLAQGDLDMDTLMERLLGNCIDMRANEHYQGVVGLMLSKRMIIIRDGVVTIGDGIDTAA